MKLEKIVVKAKNEVQICTRIAAADVGSHGVLVIANPLEVDGSFPLRLDNYVTKKTTRKKKKRTQFRNHDKKREN